MTKPALSKKSPQTTPSKSIQNLGLPIATVMRAADTKAEDHLLVGAFPRRGRLPAGRLLKAGMNRGVKWSG